MANYVAPQDQEQQVKKLKRLLEGWRMALLPLKSIILWEQQWYPCAIFGVVSFLYFLIWLMDLNSLATFAFVGLFFNLVDFMVPVVCNSIYGPAAWTGQKEKMFEDICKNIVVSYNRTFDNIRTFYSMRESSPCMAGVRRERAQPRRVAQSRRFALPLGKFARGSTPIATGIHNGYMGAGRVWGMI